MNNRTRNAGASPAKMHREHSHSRTSNMLQTKSQFRFGFSYPVLWHCRFAVVAPIARFSVLLILLASFAVAQSSWTPGRFGELVTGKSKTRDVFRVLGPAEGKPGKRIITYTYPGKGDFGGVLTVEISRATGTVEAITSRPSQNITRTEAYRKFGKDYDEVTYAVAKCGEGTNPPVYRQKNGPVELLEYPKQGVVLWPNAYGFDIAAIVYLAKPLPVVKPRCR